MAANASDMEASFSFRVDPARDLVHVVLAGFFSADAVAQFTAVRDAEMAKLRCGRNEHLTLVDIRDMKIQSQDSVNDFQRVLSNPQTRGRAIAFVVAQSLARQQALRVAAGRRHAAYFDTMEAAERWLFDENRAAA